MNRALRDIADFLNIKMKDRRDEMERQKKAEKKSLDIITTNDLDEKRRLIPDYLNRRKVQRAVRKRAKEGGPFAVSKTSLHDIFQDKD